uniref:EMI domain-containing protein n=1 Tax=Aquila chrysaetos chrysaetos TaxID=223781 RepID=A0A663DQS8_AQUCH
MTGAGRVGRAWHEEPAWGRQAPEERSLCVGWAGGAGGALGPAPGLSAPANWCSYTVTRTVSCHVQNGTFLQRVFQGCRWPLACSGGSYRTVVRPIYRVTYKTLTALEWRCCPGHAGANCEEGENRHRPWEGGLILPCAAPRRPSLRPTAFSGGSLPKPAAFGMGEDGWVPPTQRPVPPPPLSARRVPELQPRWGADSPARHP